MTVWRPKNMKEQRQGRINLNAASWLRLRRIYADQAIPAMLDWQNIVAGLWLSTLGKMACGLSKELSAPAPMIFVIGHWRSGTTFLHELLCSNPNFNFPSTYACMNPQIFPLTHEAVLRSAKEQSITRPMDNMSISLDSPQEDEFALLALGAPSPYEGLLFPRALQRAMSTADPEDLQDKQKKEWIGIFSRFLAQVSRQKPGCPLVLKSPTHAYRVKLLAQLFPQARFIHIVRNPLDVYNSTLNMWKKLCSLYAIGDLCSDEELSGQVISNWILLEEKLDAAITKLGAGSYVRVRYEDLSAQPLAEMQKIYEQLELKGFADALPAMESLLASRAGFEKNRFELSAEKTHSVFSSWRSIFEKYGYPAPTSPA